MCLDKLENFKINRYVGYVVMCTYYQSRSRYLSLFRCFHTYRIGIKYIAVNARLLTLKGTTNSNLEQYTSGFHIFLRKKDAIKYKHDGNSGNGHERAIIVKCKFSKVLAKGLQNGMKCIVANERTLLKEVK